MTAATALAPPGPQFAAIVLALTALRIISLVIGHPDLGPDEGQYWFWSRTPDWGYFSKPPLVAWSIAATTTLFGDQEWAVRLSAPLYQAGAAVFLFFLGRRLAGPGVGLWASLAWLTLPGVFLSSALITTDAPLIFFWCAALFFFFALTDDKAQENRRALAVFLGAAIGFGMLAKYAMTFFVLGAVLAIVLSSARRKAFGGVNALIAAAVALAIVAPNVAWNAAHDFQTIAHTAANADWNGSFGHPQKLAEFLVAQIGVAGPIMLCLIVAATMLGRKTASEREKDMLRTLLAFAAPAFAVVSTQAFISRAHGNWAAVAYPSAILLATIWAFKTSRAKFAAKASVILHSMIGLGFIAAFSSVPFAEAVGAKAAFKRLEGWEAQGAEIARRSQGFDAIMADDREVTGELVYYARRGKPIVAWNSNASIDSHFEAFYQFDPRRQRRVLYVTTSADALYIQNRFRAIRPIGSVDASLGRGRTRRLYLFEVSDFLR